MDQYLPEVKIILEKQLQANYSVLRGDKGIININFLKISFRNC